MIRVNTSLANNPLEAWNGSTWVSVTPFIGSGGNLSEVTIGGVTYRLHTFLSSGNSSFQVLRGGSMEYLVVAGGGGGGGTSNANSQAGFGGQVLTGSLNVGTGTFTVSVGAGGTGVFWAGSAGKGGNSALSGPGISTVTAQGGRGGNSSACCPSNTVQGQEGFTGGPTSTSFESTSSITYGSNGVTQGSLNAAGAFGAANTGNGGNAPWSSPNNRGGDGGSGRVVIRYPIAG
jgi:hypothetical protein